MGRQRASRQFQNEFSGGIVGVTCPADGTIPFASLPRHFFGAIYVNSPWRFETWSEKGKGRSARSALSDNEHGRVAAGLTIADVKVIIANSRRAHRLPALALDVLGFLLRFRFGLFQIASPHALRMVDPGALAIGAPAA